MSSDPQGGYPTLGSLTFYFHVKQETEDLSLHSISDTYHLRELGQVI